MYHKIQSSFLKGSSGTADISAIIAIAAIPLCAFVGSYIGQGIGWLAGSITGKIPYVNLAVQYFVKRVGMDAYLNSLTIEAINLKIFQLYGTVAGFGLGNVFPFIALRYYKRKKDKKASKNQNPQTKK